MKIKRWVGLFLVGTLTLAGCGQKKITEGIIYQKEFKPERTSTTFIPMVHFNGKTSYTTYIPIINHYPDRWCIYIKSLNKDDEGKYQTAEYYTTEAVYNDCEIGYMFSYEENRDFSEEPVEKSKAG